MDRDLAEIATTDQRAARQRDDLADTVALAERCVAYYRALTDAGVPASLAGPMTIHYNQAEIGLGVPLLSETDWMIELDGDD
jgi:hypothetical protein